MMATPLEKMQETTHLLRKWCRYIIDTIRNCTSIFLKKYDRKWMFTVAGIAVLFFCIAGYFLSSKNEAENIHVTVDDLIGKVKIEDLIKEIEKSKKIESQQKIEKERSKPTPLVFSGESFETGLKKLEARLNEDREVNEIESNIIKEELETLRNHSQQTIAELQGRIDEMQQEVDVLRQVTSAKTELSRSELPFSVLSIDQWNDQPLIAIQMNGRSDLMSLNEERMGWKLIDIHVSKKQAVFMNEQKQIVKVAL